MKQSLFSISNRLALMVLMAALFVGGGIGFSYLQTQNIFTADKQNELEVFARADAQKVTTYTMALTSQLEGLAKSSLVTAPIISDDPELATESLIEIANSYDTIDALTVYSAEGEVLATSKENTPQEISTKNTQETMFDVIKGLYLTEDETPALGLVTPVASDSGEIIGMLHLEAPANPLFALLHQDANQSGSNYESFLLDAEGLSASPIGSEDTALFEKTKSVDELDSCFDSENKNGVLAITQQATNQPIAQQHIPALNLCLVSRVVNTDVLSAPLAEIQKVNLGIIVTLLLTGIGFWGYAYISISKPLITLTEFAVTISQGKINTPFPDIKRKDEIGSLATAFNKLIVSLKLAMRENAAAQKETSDDDANSI